MPDWTPDIRGRLSMVRLSPAREAEVVEELNAHLEAVPMLEAYLRLGEERRSSGFLIERRTQPSG